MRDLRSTDPKNVGNYRLLAWLGQGGMGTVYLGRSKGGRFVAVKTVHPHLSDTDGFRERFAREVRTARLVSGPGTVKVVGSDPDAEVPWMATDYIPGPSLRAAVSGGGALEAGPVWRMLEALATTLHHVHGQGITHRDIKPENILLGTKRPLLIDFGIARAVDGTSLTTTGVAIGTPGCMAPEQAQGKPTGPEADVFSLAAATVFALTGTGPFGTGTPADVIYRSVYEEPQLDDVPAELSGYLRDCLAKDPKRRMTCEHLVRVAAAHASRGVWPPRSVSEEISLRSEYLLNWETPAPTSVTRQDPPTRKDPATSKTTVKKQAAGGKQKTAAEIEAQRKKDAERTREGYAAWQLENAKAAARKEQRESWGGVAAVLAVIVLVVVGANWDTIMKKVEEFNAAQVGGRTGVSVSATPSPRYTSGGSSSSGGQSTRRPTPTKTEHPDKKVCERFFDDFDVPNPSEDGDVYPSAAARAARLAMDLYVDADDDRLESAFKRLMDDLYDRSAAYDPDDPDRFNTIVGSGRGSRAVGDIGARCADIM